MSGLGSYVRLLRLPDAAALAFWGVVGRLPLAMRPIGCLMVVSAVTGSLGDAGTVTAAMLVSQGAASPVLGRLADRYSQRRVLLVACPGHVVGMGLLLLSVGLGAPLGVMVAAAVLTGSCAISFTGFMRARWTAMVEQKMLRTAYAMESMLDDTIFLLGPLLVTVLASGIHPATGLVACMVLTTAGSVAVALHRPSEPACGQTPGGRAPGRALGVPGVRVLVIAYAGMGFAFGAIDVTLIAFAREHSMPWLGGVLMALTAVGSLLAGAFYGAVNWSLSQARLLAVTTGALTLGAVPLALVGSPVVMAFVAVVSGTAIAPALISGSTLLESLAPKGALSEGFSWLSSAGWLGIALGTAAGGQLAEPGGSAHAAWAAVGGGGLALGLSLVGQPVLRKEQEKAEPLPVPDEVTGEPWTARAEL